jgi:hypothetical protein
LRKLVLRYAAAWADDLVKHNKFRELLVEDPILSRDLVCAMTRKPGEPEESPEEA